MLHAVALSLGSQYCLTLSIVTAGARHKTAKDFNTEDIYSSPLHFVKLVSRKKKQEK